MILVSYGTGILKGHDGIGFVAMPDGRLEVIGLIEKDGIETWAPIAIYAPGKWDSVCYGLRSA